jgi:alpha-D-ribose 1-methylphosphonate 5-triphosphate synthase subunit PhnG
MEIRAAAEARNGHHDRAGPRRDVRASAVRERHIHRDRVVHVAGGGGPTLSISDTTVTRATRGQSARFHGHSVAGGHGPRAVNWSTANGTATQPSTTARPRARSRSRRERPRRR